MVISKLKIGTYLLLIALFAVPLFFLWQENNRLKDSLDVLIEDQKQIRENHKKNFDSIAEVVHWQLQDIATLKLDIEHLESTKADINKKSKDEKDRINSFTSADSLEQFFARRFGKR